MNYVFAISLIFTAFTAFLIWREPRRFGNAILVLFALGLWMLTLIAYCAVHPDSPLQTVVLLGILAVPLLYLGIIVFLFINGIIVIRREGLSVAHALGLALSMLMMFWPFIVFLVVGLIGIQFSVLVTFWIVTILLFCMVTFVAFILYSLVYCLLPKNLHCDYVIIHGAGLKADGTLTPLLQRRADKAIQIYHRCKEHPMLVPSGGQGSDEKNSEAQAITNYLFEKGIPLNAILPEQQSTTTFENLSRVKEILDERENGHPYQCLFITNNYHVLRTALYAKKLKLNAAGVGCKTAGYFLPSAAIREYIAVMKETRSTLIFLAVLLVIEFILFH